MDRSGGRSLSLAPVSSAESSRKILVAVGLAVRQWASGTSATSPASACLSDTFARYHRLRGNDVLMVSGTDEHGTPVMVAADAAGESPRETADRFNALIREDLPLARALVRPLHAHDDEEPLHASRRTSSGRSTRRAIVIEHETLGAFSASTGAYAARPLHRGHVPDLRLSKRARRPVRQLRQPARSRRPDRPALEDRRHAAGVPDRRSTSSSTCRRSAEQLTAWIESQGAAGGRTSRSVLARTS